MMHVGNSASLYYFVSHLRKRGISAEKISIKTIGVVLFFIPEIERF